MLATITPAYQAARMDVNAPPVVPGTPFGPRTRRPSGDSFRKEVVMTEEQLRLAMRELNGERNVKVTFVGVPEQDGRPRG